MDDPRVWLRLPDPGGSLTATADKGSGWPARPHSARSRPCRGGVRHRASAPSRKLQARLCRHGPLLRLDRAEKPFDRSRGAGIARKEEGDGGRGAPRAGALVEAMGDGSGAEGLTGHRVGEGGVIEARLAQPAVTVTALATQLGLSRQTIHVHLVRAAAILAPLARAAPSGVILRRTCWQCGTRSKAAGQSLCSPCRRQYMRDWRRRRAGGAVPTAYLWPPSLDPTAAGRGESRATEARTLVESA